MSAPPPRLRLSGISKTYPSVVANAGIDLTVEPGEIRAVLGENGAGKSTLMKIAYGVVQPDAGSIEWNGRQVSIESPAQARALGIGMVFQHFALFETLTVAENISLALDRHAAGPGLADRIRGVSVRYGLPVDPHRHVHTMSMGERQRVEILRCLLQSPQLLIMDEPTSVLTPQAVQQLFETLRELAGEGCSILYISHRLDDIRVLCHSATVLRAGRVTGECDPRRETVSSLARMMIGTDLPHPKHRTTAQHGDASLTIRGLSAAASDPFGTSLDEIDLTVCGGEIVGIAGISGNGQRELLAALSGEQLTDPVSAVAINGIAVGAMDAAARRGLGLAFVPEERVGRGSVPEMSLADNALLTAYGQGLLRGGFVRSAAVHRFAEATIEAFGVKTASPEVAAGSLSGGNLQKFIVGREIRQAPRVMIAAQPTWGVDVGAAAFIRQALVDLRDSGVAVLVVSEDLDELFEICDRIAVIARGRLTPAKSTRETNAEEMGLLMSSPGAMAAVGGRSAPSDNKGHAHQA